MGTLKLRILERLAKGDVKYRFVIDVAKTLRAEWFRVLQKQHISGVIPQVEYVECEVQQP